MKYTVKPQYLEALRGCTMKQGQNAHALGVLEWETQRERDRLATSGMTAQADLFALGTLEWNYAQKREFFLAAIRRVEVEQKATGDAALRELGLPDELEHTIDLQTGAVIRVLQDPLRHVDDF